MKSSIDKLVDAVHEGGPPVRSLLDIDFYKLTMGQMIHRLYRGVEVVFELIIRDKDIKVSDVVPEDSLREALDYARTLRVRMTDIYYLRGIDLYGGYMFKEDYLNFLKTLELPPYELSRTSSGDYKLTFRGEWAEVTMWETIVLAIVSELYYRSLVKRMSAREIENMYARAMVKMLEKFEKIRNHPQVRYSEFGTRRRHSFFWQKWVVGEARQVLGSQLVGTSNVWMAFHYDLQPIGTNAHELPMVLTALADSPHEMYSAQYRVLEEWQSIYGQGLRVILPDTYGSQQFFSNAPSWVASWKGFRQDSGSPDENVELYISWLRAHGEDPKEKLFVPSDGLDVGEMVRLARKYSDQINVSAGWGTLHTNDFRECSGEAKVKPFSMVCKVVEANGRPCVKLSDNIAKATGPKSEVERYLKVFGREGRVDEKVSV